MDVEKILKISKPIAIESRTVLHIILVRQKISEKVSIVLKPFDVSMQQFNVLRILKGQNGNAANLSTLNERMVTKMSNTTRLVDKLIVKDYVKRSICKNNRRKIELFITDKGIKNLEKMSKAMAQVEKEMVKSLSTTEMNELNRLLHKLNTNN